MATMKIHSVQNEKKWFCKKRSYTTREAFVICDGREKIPFSNVISIEEVDTQEHKTVFTKKKLAGLGLLATFSAVGVISGLLLGSKNKPAEQHVTFLAELEDDRSFLATLEIDAYNTMISAIEEQHRLLKKATLIEKQRQLDSGDKGGPKSITRYIPEP